MGKRKSRPLSRTALSDADPHGLSLTVAHSQLVCRQSLAAHRMLAHAAIDRPYIHPQIERTPIMNQIISIALLVGGVILIIFGISAMDSFSSDVSQFFTGSPTDKSIWMLVGGIILAVAGLGGFMMRSRSR